jgi:DNA (cytosine-5)-methyltransferase 1
MNIISLFSGCGGLDLGFRNAGFNVVWANDFNKSVQETFEHNHRETEFIQKDISKIPSNEIPDNIIGIVGGPPCQSWSNAGNGDGFEDTRGRLFYEFIRVIKDKQPLFFLAENVKGITAKRHGDSLKRILKLMGDAGYLVSYHDVNANNYGVPQNRERIIFVGYSKDLGMKFIPPLPLAFRPTVRDAILDLNNTSIPSLEFNRSNKDRCLISNHEHYRAQSHSYIFMSRNRVLSWDRPSFTLQASGRHTPIHPTAPPMEKVKKDVMRFQPGLEHLYKRLSVRECARIQTFPDDFDFFYDNVDEGYKMIGNAVPVNLAYHMALQIKKDLELFANL